MMMMVMMMTVYWCEWLESKRMTGFTAKDDVDQVAAQTARLNWLVWLYCRRLS
jgi:hypothetical protein